MQKVLTMATERDSLRAAAIGWGAEDPDQWERAKIRPAPHAPLNLWDADRIGLVPPYQGMYRYGSVFQALADGWKLLAPPIKYLEGDVECWEWWLTKEA